MKFEVPQRQQTASERTSLTLFAPAPYTISFVPLTRNLSLADLLPRPGVDRPLRGNCHPLQSIHRLLNVPPVATVKLVNAYQFEKFGTGNSLLRYGIRIRCSKRHPGVRDAFSEAFGVKNRLFRYGRNIRYQKRPPTVRDACAVMCPPRMVLPLFTKVGIVFNKTVIFDLLTNKQEEHSLLYKPKVSIFAA